MCRAPIPAGAAAEFDHEFPFAWLGILAAARAVDRELIYAPHDRGFALHSLRSPEISRLYLQVEPDEDLAAWPDERIWDELRVRLASTTAGRCAEGPVLEKGIAPMRSFVVEPMQYGRLFLAGDAAHIVPATGAKGLNLAVARRPRARPEGWRRWYAARVDGGAGRYSRPCLGRVWRVQEFSSWMSSMLHRLPDETASTAAAAGAAASA